MELTKLGSILHMEKGKKPKAQAKVPTDGYLPYVDIKAFEQGVIDNYATTDNSLLCDDGDLLIVCDGSRSGLTGIAIKGVVGSTLSKIYADGLTTKYLRYYIQSKYTLLNTRKKGTGTPHLNAELLKKSKLIVPSIPEQERIVARIEELFSELDKAVETLQATKKQLGVYRQAVLKEAFEGNSRKEYHPLEDIIIGTPQNGLYKPRTAYGSGTRILRIDGFYNGYILSNYDFKRLILTPMEVERYSLQLNDLVINRVNSMPYLGKCALVRNLDEPMVFESNMMRIKINNEKINPDYITYYLSSFMGHKELTKNAKQAVNQASINQADVKNALVPIPESLEYQREIVEQIESRLSVCDSIEKTVDAALAQAEAMRQSILKEAFEGRLI